MLNLLSATTARVRIEPMKKKGNVRSKVDLNTSAQWLKIWRWQHILDSVCAAQNKAINIYIYTCVCYIRLPLVNSRRTHASQLRPDSPEVLLDPCKTIKYSKCLPLALTRNASCHPPSCTAVSVPTCTCSHDTDQVIASGEQSGSSSVGHCSK